MDASNKWNKGFTLIELLIVVAIVGILAAIAIPQFSNYRMKGHNSAAQSDLRNMVLNEESFFSAWQCYASTGVGGVPGAPTIIYGPTTTPIVVAVVAITATQPSSATILAVGLSNGVSLGIYTAALGANYAMVTKSTTGDRWFGMDSFQMYVSIGTPASRGVVLVVGDVPTATSGTDFTGATPTGAGAAVWTPL
jgi:prepilin-type N-terminal cleavage/methylation domain-containing protein